MWSVCGGLLLYFLTCNILTLLVKPSWDEPIRTISDLLERDMELILWANYDYYIEVMRDSPVDQYNKDSFMIKKTQNIYFYLQLSEKTSSFSGWDITNQRLQER